MQTLLKNTYLLDNKGIEKSLNRLWFKYQKLLKKPSWKGLNEARAILYLLGQIYCEQIAVQAIERRLHLLRIKLSLQEFLELVDSNSKKLKNFQKDLLFKKLETFYRLVKNTKNKITGGKYYLDEERFIKLYNKFNPDKSLKIGYRGKFGKIKQ